MRINKIDNQPSFGIRYQNITDWNPKTLNAFKKSKLLKDIDKKYPDACVSYFKQNSIDFFGEEVGYNTLSAFFHLDKNKISKWEAIDKKRGVVEEKFVEFLKKASIEDLELKLL